MLGTRRLPRCAMAMALMVLSAWRTSAQDQPPRLKGTVQLEEQPIASGRIYFYLDENQFFGAVIRNGAFAIQDPPSGVWRVAIVGPGLPEKYSAPETAGLQAETRPAMNTINFVISAEKPKPKPKAKSKAQPRRP